MIAGLEIETETDWKNSTIFSRKTDQIVKFVLGNILKLFIFIKILNPLF